MVIKSKCSSHEYPGLAPNLAMKSPEFLGLNRLNPSFGAQPLRPMGSWRAHPRRYGWTENPGKVGKCLPGQNTPKRTQIEGILGEWATLDSYRIMKILWNIPLNHCGGSVTLRQPYGLNGILHDTTKSWKLWSKYKALWHLRYVGTQNLTWGVDDGRCRCEGWNRRIHQREGHICPSCRSVYTR